MTSAAPSSPAQLAARAREVFVQQVLGDLPQLSQRLLEDLLARAEQARYGEQAQRIDDARVRWIGASAAWMDEVRERLNASLLPTSAPLGPTTVAAPLALSLVEDESVENQILAARAALVAVDQGSEAFNELRLRLQRLELTDELDKRDPVQAINVMQILVQAWLHVGLTRSDWQLCQDTWHKLLAKVLAQGYVQANQFLLSQGVLPDIDLRHLVRRGGRLPLEAAGPATGVTAVPPASAVGGVSVSGQSMQQQPAWPVPAAGQPQPPARVTGWQGAEVDAYIMQRVQGYLMQSGMGVPGPAGAPAAATGYGVVPPVGGMGAMPAGPPLAAVDWSTLESGVQGVRSQARALKQAVHTDAEKAVIEMVALIFDSILAQDRIDASIRVWFARLQMPLLRHALQDASFLTQDQHPARVLLDRMGACVLGFEASAPMPALEAEIKRIVQTIEQYPETGRRVYELMLKEFETFLAQAVAQEPHLQRASVLATQLEQRGAATVQYTIELRRLLEQTSVHEGLRGFLFQIWVDVMAHATVAFGADDARTRSARQLVADMLWAASAKPNRQERAQVIAQVPGLMTRLRQGLSWIGMDASAQERATQAVSDALAAAFVSRTPALDAQWLARFTQALVRLEVVLSDDPDPVPLSRESLEWVAAQDMGDIVVLADPAEPTPKHLLAWADALPVGSGYALEHNNVRVTVRLSWISPRRQLYLFRAGHAAAYLLQQGRVAQYLKAGKLRAAQAEPLMRQATRDALDKLQAQPERLLA